jgi:AcrR family transcriptional regulator
MESTQARLLEASAGLFAEHGYEGVSMRQIARATNLTQAAIYHHFPTKNDLYIAAIQHIYTGRTIALVSEVSRESDPEKQLGLVVESLLRVFADQPQFQQIYFRELLTGDRERLQFIAEQVFPEIDNFLDSLMRELAPHMDSHLMVLSLAGLLLHHLEARKLSQVMDEGKPQHQELDTLAQHITALLLHGVSRP